MSKLTIALADCYGDLLGEPGIAPLGRTGIDTVPIDEKDLIPMPAGTSIMMLPNRSALGAIYKKKKLKQIEIDQVEGERVYPASAIIPPGYTRTLIPAYKTCRKAKTLPFFAYTALAWKNNELYCAAIETHRDIRWNPAMYNSLELPKKIKLKIKKHPNNRLLKHLKNCSLEYKCFTAQNIFYERWEGGIPTSPKCNARCIGCISQKRIDETDSPQDRICFIPTPDEIAELSIEHLNTPQGIISFGQGCEGEPLLQGELIIKAIEKTRASTSLGTININTNGSKPKIVEKMFKKGLDSIRVSLNSTIEENYNSYFNPKDYKFDDILKTIDIGISMGKFVSINYLYLPGVNDREEEKKSFFKFLKKHPISMIQFRNLNIDPDYYFKAMKQPQGKAFGTINFIKSIKKEFPSIIIGNFTIPHS